MKVIEVFERRNGKRVFAGYFKGWMLYGAYSKHEILTNDLSEAHRFVDLVDAQRVLSWFSGGIEHADTIVFVREV